MAKTYVECGPNCVICKLGAVILKGTEDLPLEKWTLEQWQTYLKHRVDPKRYSKGYKCNRCGSPVLNQTLRGARLDDTKRREALSVCARCRAIEAKESNGKTGS